MRDGWISQRNIGLRLTVVPAADSAPIAVFVHGMMLHADAYGGRATGADFLGALRDQGLTVVALDLPGHGRSDGRRGDLLFRDAVQAIQETVAYSRERTGRPVGLVGSGLGATLAFYAGLEDDRVAAVACHTLTDLRDVDPVLVRLRQRLVAGGARAARGLAEHLPLLPLPVRAVFSPLDFFEDPGHVAALRRLPRVVRRYTLRSMVSMFLTPEDKPDAEAMEKPVLVLAGEEDRIFPLAVQQAVAARVPGARLEVVPGAGHMLPLEHLPVAAPLLGGWLRERLAGDPAKAAAGG